MASLRIRAALGLVLVTMFLAGPALSYAMAASAQDISDYEVKAAMLVHFSKFVEWPADSMPTPSMPLTIGVVGNDPFGEVLDRIARGQTVAGHSLVVKRYLTIADLDGAPRMLFISESERSHLSKLKDRLAGAAVLTVGDFPFFAQLAGVIGFVQDGDRIGFEINVRDAERCRLKISSKLLTLAKTVITNEAGR